MSISILRLLTTIATLVGLTALVLCADGVHGSQQTRSPSSVGPAVLDLIQNQKYNDAITQLEQLLEREPGNGEAITYLATANLYRSRDFFKARDEFQQAFKAGGGATFFVTHSHEMFTTSDVVDYCRGWLHLRKDSVEFSPTEGGHGFKVQVGQITEFAVNKLSKRAFHIKAGGKSQNFRGRSNTDLEPLLIVGLYKNFKDRDRLHASLNHVCSTQENPHHEKAPHEIFSFPTHRSVCLTNAALDSECSGSESQTRARQAAG